MVPRTERLLKSILVSIGAFGVIVLLVNLAQSVAQRPAAATQQRPVINYNATRVCDDAFAKQIDYSKSEITHFEITLSNGCWSGIVTVPNWWMRNMDGFNVQSSGDQQGFWVSYWFTPFVTPTHIYGPNHTAFFQNAGGSFRTQGHGKIIFFTHNAPLHPEPTSKPAVEPTPTTPSEPHPAETDPIPDEHGVYQVGGRVSSPVLISKVEPEFSDEARKTKWSGIVSASVVIGVDGTIQDIAITNSPGMGIDEKVVETLHRWKFRPGQLDGNPVPVRSKIDVTFRWK
jgi:TonB family protein